MAYTYTAWPTAANVFDVLTASNIDPTVDVGSDLVSAWIAAAAQEMVKRASRQFVAGSAGEIRYFDGSGDGMQTVDEFVDVTAVEFLMYPQVAGVQVTYWYEKLTNGYPNTVLQIVQGPSNTNYGYITMFPKGRSNIKVTGTWGYGSSIPVDVWTAVQEYAAAKIAASNSLSAQGKLAKWVDGDVSEDYGGDMPGEVAGWIKNFRETARRYRRPYRELRRRQQVELL